MSAANLEMQSLNNPQSPEEPASSNILRDSRSKKLLVVLTILSVLISCVGIFLFFQNQSLKSQLGLPTFKFPWMRATCSYEGQEYQAGESVPSIDGCNSCSCDESGQVACTDMACEDDLSSDLLIPDPNERSDWQTHTGTGYAISYPPDAEIFQSADASKTTLISSANPEYAIILAVNSQGSACMNGPCDQSREAMVAIDGKDELITLQWPDARGNFTAQAQLTDPNDSSQTITINAEYKDESTLPIITSILSTFSFAQRSILEQSEITLTGTLKSMERPSPEINYDYQLELDTPYFDELNAQGPRNITSIVVVPENESIRQRLASNIGNAVSIEGVIEWGLAETRHLKASKIVVTPDN